jgi:sialic acid synthase SpsE
MSKIKVIAEIANAHQGVLELALKLAEESAKAGVDAVKYQIYFADEFLTTTHPRYEHFKKQSFSKSTFISLCRLPSIYKEAF